MIRADPLRHYLSYMREMGAADRDVLAGTSVADSEHGTSNTFVSHGEYQAIVDNMLRIAGDRGLGLELGLNTELRHLGILGYAALSCRTIRESIELGARYGNAFGFWGGMRPLQMDGDLLTLHVLAPWRGRAAYRFAVEAHLAFFLRACRSTAGVEPRLEQLSLSYAAPAYWNRYTEIFPCCVNFDALQTQIVVRANWLDAPLATHDEELNRLCTEHLDDRIRQIDASVPVAMRLRERLLQQPKTGFSLEGVAADIGMSPRSLERQLQNDGYSFRKLVEEVRLHLAQKWLGYDLPTKQISHRLGFSDVNAFRRAFKSWTGKTVTEFRVTGPNVRP